MLLGGKRGNRESSESLENNPDQRLWWLRLGHRNVAEGAAPGPTEEPGRKYS